MGLREELVEAKKAYKKAGEAERVFECSRYLYDEFSDYDGVKDFRAWLSKKYDKSQRTERILDLAKRSYFLTAKDKFDDYMVAMEWNRPMRDKFYLPRRAMLYTIVTQMQRLIDDELDLLGISAPPGIGKTGLGDFFMTMLAGRHPEEGQLMGSHSKSILTDNYSECLRMLTSDEYCWGEIFPEHSVKKTNALDLKIDIDTPRKFSSLQFGSLGSGLAGRVRALQLLYCDDLIPNIEVAMNKEQLEKIWTQYTADFKQRKQGDKVKELHIATRWSVWDVLGRLERSHEDDDRAEFIKIPALNENGFSNFDYGGSIGFSTKFFLDIKKDLDDASWRAIYMNDPIEREGLLYPIEELRTYFDLPVEEPDGIFAVCDTKDQGTDDCVMPVGYKYGNDYYIHDFICDSSLPNITTPRIVNTLVHHRVKMARFESNSAGGRIAKDVQEGVKSQGGITTITTKFSTRNKETRMIVDSGWVKEHCLFKDKALWNGDYQKAMNKLTGFAITSKGKNLTDDVPDAMSMFADLVQSFDSNVLVLKKRIF